MEYFVRAIFVDIVLGSRIWVTAASRLARAGSGAAQRSPGARSAAAVPGRGTRSAARAGRGGHGAHRGREARDDLLARIARLVEEWRWRKLRRRFGPWQLAPSSGRGGGQAGRLGEVMLRGEHLLQPGPVTLFSFLPSPFLLASVLPIFSRTADLQIHRFFFWNSA